MIVEPESDWSAVTGHVVHLSDGAEWVGTLTVVNVTGISEERGWRLFWESPCGRYQVPAAGYATSNPFRTRKAAVLFGIANYGVKARKPT